MMKKLIFMLMLPAMAFGNPPTTPQEAFQQAQVLANSGATVPDQTTLNSALGGMNQSYYSDTSGSSLSGLSGGTTAALAAAATNKIQRCANGNQTDPLAQQDCNAVNLMVNNPQNRPTFNINPSFFAASQNIVANANTTASSYFSGGGGAAQGNSGFSACTNKTSPAPTQTRSCTEFTGTPAQQCLVGNTVLVNDITDYQCEQTVDRMVPQTCEKTVVVTVTPQKPIQTTNNPLTIGGEVPAVSAKTMAMDLVPTPDKRYVMTYFHGDNYGQLWVNGRLVYDATYSIGFTDVRGAILGQECIGTGRNKRCDTKWLMTNGNYAPLYDVGCPWGSPCMGVATAVDLAPYITNNSTNTIELACANVGGPGPCYATISVFSCPVNHTIAGAGTSAICVPPPVVSSTVNNGCAVQEAAAL